MQLSNHHELMLAGISITLTTLAEHRGPINILIRNKPTLSTTFSSKHGINSHYAIQANKLLLQWFNAAEMNRVYLGWYPTDYMHPAIWSLDLHVEKRGSSH